MVQFMKRLHHSYLCLGILQKLKSTLTYLPTFILCTKAMIFGLTILKKRIGDDPPSRRVDYLKRLFSVKNVSAGGECSPVAWHKALPSSVSLPL